MSPDAGSPLPPRSGSGPLESQAAELIAQLAAGKAPAQPGRSQRPAGRARLLAYVFAAVALSAGAYLLVTFDRPSRNTSVPAELIGLWRTMAPSHADRPFEITDTSLVFHIGGSDSTVHPIADIRRDASGYTIDYLVSGAVYSLSFSFIGGQAGQVIQFRNQPRLAFRKQP